jgi:DNA-binding XRE family transcriptional regulator
MKKQKVDLGTAMKKKEERTTEQRFAHAVELARQRGYQIENEERKRKRVATLVSAIMYAEVSEETQHAMLEAVVALLERNANLDNNYFDLTAKSEPVCYACGCDGCEAECNKLLVGRAKEWLSQKPKAENQCCGHAWAKDSGIYDGGLPF